MPAGFGLQKSDELGSEEVNDILIRAGFRQEDLDDEGFGRGTGGLGTVIGVALFSALGGGLFGLDIGYIAGVTSMPSFCDDLSASRPLTDLQAGTVTGTFALGAIVAACPPVISHVVNPLGRMGAIVVGGGIFCCGALLQSLAPSLPAMCAGRLIGGAAVGLLSANIPIFQGEIAPPQARGMVVALYQLAITAGILVAFWTNFLLRATPHGWRFSIAAQLLPGLLLLVGGLLMPGSPRWFVQKHKPQEALRILQKIRGPQDDVRMELAQICREFQHDLAAGKPSCTEFVSGGNGQLLTIGVLLQMLQQMCGLNLFMYYGPVIFERIFRSSRAAFLFSAITGIVNFVSTFPAIMLSDRVGRMALLRYSSAGMAVSCVVLAVVGSSCFGGVHDPSCQVIREGECGYRPGAAAQLPARCASLLADVAICGDWSKLVTAGAVFFFIFNFAYGWGPVVWIYCAEIFPLKYRTAANGLTTDANWMGNFFIGFFPPMMISALGFRTFWIFAAVNLVGLVAASILPETKGQSLEEIQLMFSRWHRHKGHLLPACASEDGEPSTPTTASNDLSMDSDEDVEQDDAERWRPA